MTPDEAERLQAAYREQRRAYLADPELGLIPWPLRRVKRKPEPAVIDGEDPELG